MTERAKPYMEMTEKELAKATAKFDKEFVIDDSREATSYEKTRWQRANRNHGGRRMDS
jgi:hypothetical protein